MCTVIAVVPGSIMLFAFLVAARAIGLGQGEGRCNLSLHRLMPLCVGSGTQGMAAACAPGLSNTMLMGWGEEEGRG